MTLAEIEDAARYYPSPPASFMHTTVDANRDRPWREPTPLPRRDRPREISDAQSVTYSRLEFERVTRQLYRGWLVTSRVE
jgi:hypothetical protein